MKKKESAFSTKELKGLLNAVDCVKDSAVEAFNVISEKKVPCNRNIMFLGMLIQAAYAFHVALDAWIELSEEVEEGIKIEERDKN